MKPQSDKVLEEILDPLADATSNSFIKSIAETALSSIGIESWIFACDNPNSVFGMTHIMSGIPLQWVATYVAKGYVKIDPIIKHCRESEEALYWDSTEELESAEDNVRDFMRNLLASGLKSGMAIPLRSSSGKKGILSIASSQPLKEKKEDYIQHQVLASTIGVALQSAIERISSK